jgi:hypothetical protein
MNRLRQDSQDYVQTDEYVEYVRRAQQVPDEQETPTPDLSNFVGPRDPSTHPSAPQQLKDPSVRQQLEAYLKANPLSLEQEEQMNQAQQEQQARQTRNAELIEQDYQARQARQTRQAEAVSLGFAPEGQPLRVALDDEFEDSLEAGTGISFYEGRASTPPSFSVGSSFSLGDIYVPSPIQSPFIDFRSLNQQNMAGVSGTSVPMGAAIGRGGKRAPPGSQSVSLLPRQGSSARKSLNLDLPATKVDQQFQSLFDGID